MYIPLGSNFMHVQPQRNTSDVFIILQKRNPVQGDNIFKVNILAFKIKLFYRMIIDCFCRILMVIFMFRTFVMSVKLKVVRQTRADGPPPK